MKNKSNNMHFEADGFFSYRIQFSIVFHGFRKKEERRSKRKMCRQG